MSRRANWSQVWKSTAAGRSGVWTSPIYADFFTAVRDVNSKLPAGAQIRVFGGDPGPPGNRNRDAAAVSLLKEQVLQKHGKALVIYGAAHFYRIEGDARKVLGIGEGLVTLLETRISRPHVCCDADWALIEWHSGNRRHP